MIFAKLKKSHKHIAFLDFGSFPGTIMFTVGFTYDEVFKYSKRKYKTWVNGLEKIKDTFEDNAYYFGFAAYRVDDNDVHSYFICLKGVFDFSDDSHINLAHEVLHVISYNLRDVLDPMIENEALCYTHSHVMKQAYKILRGK